MSDQQGTTIASTRDALIERRVRAVDRLEEALFREATAVHRHRCFTRIDPLVHEQARMLDARADRGEPLGPLAGACIGVKDNISIAHLPMSAGSSTWSTTPNNDADVVARLRAADALVMGTQVMHERALGLDVPHVRNAFDLRRHPGGSTAGGPVSVALGSSDVALGTDTGGSVRYPASANGVVGFKPTFDAISRAGVLAPSGTADQVGIITRSVADARDVFHSIQTDFAGDMARMEEPAPLNGLAETRVGVAMPWLRQLPRDIQDVMRQAIRRIRGAGITVVETDFEPRPWVYEAWATLNRYETFQQMKAAIEQGLQDFPPKILAELKSGEAVTLQQAQAARSARQTWRDSVTATFRRHAITTLLTPVSPISPLLIEELQPERDQPLYARYLAPFNFSGNPGLSIPAGFRQDETPVSIQLVGQWYGERRLLDIGSIFERTR